MTSPNSALGSAQLISPASSSGTGTDDASHGSVLDESQQKLLSQKIGDGDLSASHMVDAETSPGLPVPQAPEQNVMPSVSSGSTRVRSGDEESEPEEDVMGYELDLKTVGDIIAIIEDKADESAEALDAAALEAALSLCEDNGHTLAGAWDSGPFQPLQSNHTVVPGAPQCSSHQSSLEPKAKDEPAPDSTEAKTNEDWGVKVEEAKAFPSELEGGTELEPGVSESEDGYRLHTASSSLQLNTTADSIPSSPASSQSSMCSEDQEAGGSVWGEGSLGVSALPVAPVTRSRISGRRWMDEN